MAATVLRLVPDPTHLVIMQATDCQIEFQCLDKDLEPVDISSDSVKFTARDEPGGTVTIATKTNGSGEHSDAESGKTTFEIDKTDITTDRPDDEVVWYYEIRRVDSLGDETVHIYGQLRLQPVVGTS